MKTATPSRPFLRYHGGKWMLAPWIIARMPAHRVYIEPYGGAASVLLRKPRSFSEVYNDVDDEILELFQISRERGPELVRNLELTPFARREFRQANQRATCPLERARRTIIRSFMGFGSDGVHSTHVTGFRGTSNRSGTTPAHDWRNYPAALAILLERLRGVVIEHLPALRLIAKYDAPDALFYCDPPYLHSTRKRVDAARGYRHELSPLDHARLLCRLGRVQGGVILSGYPSALYERLLTPAAGWRRIERTGAFADGAQQRTEVLWLRNVPDSEPDLFPACAPLPLGTSS